MSDPLDLHSLFHSLTGNVQNLQIIQGDCREVLKTIPDESIQCCVTSPPYWGLRDYGHADQIGQEETPQAYIETMRQVLSEVWRVLRDDGTLWLNLGDSYAANIRGSGGYTEKQSTNGGSFFAPRKSNHGLKIKDLIGIPWRVAFALQAGGWYLRSDIIWAKPNPMPESVTDRCTKSHEYIFLLTKSERYYYDAAAIAEPLAYGSVERLSQQSIEDQVGSTRVPGKTNGNMKAVYGKRYTNEASKDFSGHGVQDASATKQRIVDRILSGDIITRNKRSVWTIPTASCKDAHFATFPPDLIKPCILAGTRPGDVVLDPFGGSGTTGMVALELGRRAILVELNPDYVKLCNERCTTTMGLPM